MKAQEKAFQSKALLEGQNAFEPIVKAEFFSWLLQGNYSGWFLEDVKVYLGDLYQWQEGDKVPSSALAFLRSVYSFYADIEHRKVQLEQEYQRIQQLAAMQAKHKEEASKLWKL